MVNSLGNQSLKCLSDAAWEDAEASWQNLSEKYGRHPLVKLKTATVHVPLSAVTKSLNWKRLLINKPVLFPPVLTSFQNVYNQLCKFTPVDWDIVMFTLKENIHEKSFMRNYFIRIKIQTHVYILPGSQHSNTFNPFPPPQKTLKNIYMY